MFARDVYQGLSREQHGTRKIGGSVEFLRSFRGNGCRGQRNIETSQERETGDQTSSCARGENTQEDESPLWSRGSLGLDAFSPSGVCVCLSFCDQLDCYHLWKCLHHATRGCNGVGLVISRSLTRYPLRPLRFRSYNIMQSSTTIVQEVCHRKN